MNERYKEVLGLENYKPETEYVCFLPPLMEFGWYIQTFVKRIYAYNFPNEKKIVCVKPGHEALFPTAELFYYDWKDLDDGQKAGIAEEKDLVGIADDLNQLKEKIKQEFKTDSITFINRESSNWEERQTLAHNVFKPVSKNNFDLEVDIVITPRKRKIDPNRNWTIDNWNFVIKELTTYGLTVGVCGAKDSTFEVSGAKYFSYNYVDIDSDIELMSKCKCLITQESGLLYLAMLIATVPIFVIDYYQRDNGAESHRTNKNTFFREAQYSWNDPSRLVKEVVWFVRNGTLKPD